MNPTTPSASRPPPPGPAATPPTRIGRVWIAIAGVTAVAAALAVFLITRDRPQPDKGIAAIATGGGQLAAPIASRAFDHAPTGCDVVVRVDVARLLQAPAAVIHLVPVLEDIATGAGAESPGTRRTTEFLRAAGIDPRRDITEVILCAASLETAAEQQRLAVIFGGSLRPEALVPAVAATDPDAGDRAGTFDGRRVARTRSRRGELLIVGQAADGAIVVSNDLVFFESGVKTNKNASDVYKIPTEPEAAVVVVPEFFQHPTRGPEGPLTRHRPEVRRMVMTAALAPGGAKGELRASVRDTMAAQALEADAARLLEGARAQGGDGLEQMLLGAAKLRLEGSDLLLEAPWTEANVEQAVKRAAASLREAFQKGGLAF
jgi:hypothetical protein